MLGGSSAASLSTPTGSLTPSPTAMGLRRRRSVPNPVGNNRDLIWSSMLSSITAPKITLASGSAVEMISAASLTSNRPRSRPPVMLRSMPVAPSIDDSSRGEDMAARAASTLLCSPGSGADAHQRRAGIPDDGPHVGEVEVDEPGDGDEVGYALHTLPQHVVRHFEGIHNRCATLHDLQQPIIGDDD